MLHELQRAIASYIVHIKRQYRAHYTVIQVQCRPYFADLSPSDFETAVDRAAQMLVQKLPGVDYVDASNLVDAYLAEHTLHP